MIELKTLEDLESEIYGLGHEKAEPKVKISDLKAEAIKWVKLFLEQGEIQSAIDFQNFFNLTVEDLK